MAIATARQGIAIVTAASLGRHVLRARTRPTHTLRVSHARHHRIAAIMGIATSAVAPACVTAASQERAAVRVR